MPPRPFLEGAGRDGKPNIADPSIVDQHASQPSRHSDHDAPDQE